MDLKFTTKSQTAGIVLSRRRVDDARQFILGQENAHSRIVGEEKAMAIRAMSTAGIVLSRRRVDDARQFVLGQESARSRVVGEEKAMAIRARGTASWLGRRS